MDTQSDQTPDTVELHHPAPGTLFAVRSSFREHFEVLEEVARGGTGVVYKARQRSADRIVALKVLRDSHPDSDELERFQIEVRAAANLDHPNIVPVYEVGVLQGIPFFTMKLIDGVSLQTRLNGGPIQQQEAARIVHRIAEAVQSAHDQGIIHRDIKPGNILLDAAGNPYITDFGLAREINNSAELTSEGRAVGTPSYMPPEQVLGSRRLISERSDVYSLGGLLYACLTGRPPYQGTSPTATMMQVLQREVVIPRQLNSDIDRDLETICLKCLNKNPDERYSSAQALADDLARCLRNEPVQARRATASERIRKWIRRHPAFAGLIATAAVAVICLIIAGTLGLYYVGLRASLRETEAARRVSETERQIAAAALMDARVANEKAAQSEYFRNIALAQAAWDSGNIQSMNDYLQDTNPETRGWEYSLLANMMHQQIHEVDTQSDGVTQLISAPDNSTIAAVLLGEERQVQFIDLHTGAVRRRWNSGINLHTKATFNRDFTQVTQIRAEQDGSHVLDIRDVTTEKTLRSWPSPPHLRHQVTDPHFQHAVFFYSSPWQFYRGLFMMDLNTGELRTLDDQQLVVRRAVFSGDGQTLFVTGILGDSGQGFLRSYDTHNGSLIRENVLTPEIVPNDLCILDRSDTQISSSAEIFVSSEDYRIRRFDSETLQLQQESDSVGFRLNDISGCEHLQRIAVAVDDGRILQFDAGTLQVSKQHVGHRLGASSVVYDRDGKTLWSGSYDGRILCWDSEADKPPQLLSPENQSVQQICFSRDSQLLASFHHGGRPETPLIGIWSVETGKRLQAIMEDSTGAKCHSGRVSWGAFIDSDRKLVTIGWDDTLRIWNVSDGTAIAVVSGGNTGGVQFGGISPDETLAFATGENGNTVIWDLEKQSVLKYLPKKQPRYLTMSVDPTGKYLLAGGLQNQGNNLTLHSLQNAELSVAFPGDRNNVHSVAFSPDGSYFACGGSRGHVRAMTTTTREIRWDQSQHNGTVWCVAFSPDGKRMVTGGNDRRVVVWDPQTGESILTLFGHKERVTAAAFSPDGRTLATGGHDGKIFLWR